MAAPSFLVSSQTQLSSANTTDVKTATPPVYGSHGVTLGAQSQDVYVTFDGSVPSSSNGVRIIAGAQPVTFPFVPSGTNTLQAASQAASTAKLDVIWLY